MEETIRIGISYKISWKNPVPMRVQNFYYSLKHKAISYLGTEKPNGKVFCIGYNKTGTTSLGRALEMLGYNNSSFNKNIFEDYKNGKILNVLKYTAKFDSCDDLPWLKEDMIPILDQVFPGSKFIYLKRNEESWLKSYQNWRLQSFNEHIDPERALEDFRKHKDFVFQYFSNRPAEDFLAVDIGDPEGFQKVAHFLNKTTERKRFPRFNRGKYQE
jgi:hypothetical protein